MLHPDSPVRNRARLRLLGVVVPLAGVAVLYLLRLGLLHLWPVAAADALTGALMTVGVLAFSQGVFRIIEQQDRDLERQHAELATRYAMEHRLRAQLEALHEAALTLSSTHTPEEILQRLVELARELIGARYAALGVLGPQGAIDGFYIAGITAEEREALGAPPQGHGLLGVLLTEGSALRVADIARDPRSVGFPPGHPDMRSLLGVPVAHASHVVGNLYLADKIGAEAFSPEDERLLTLLAGHAAVVIANARLALQVRTLAVAAERTRISQELHDGVIQALYATSLDLESAAEDVAGAPESARAQIDAAIDRLSAVMTDIRRYILDLQAERPADQTLPEALAAILAEARTHVMIEPRLSLKGEGVTTLPPAVAQELLQIVREAVTNVVRHARASRLWVTLEVSEGTLHLRIVDNGSGFDPGQPAPTGHCGLRNLRQRAAALGGTLTITSSADQGTAVDVQAPLGAPEQEQIHV